MILPIDFGVPIYLDTSVPICVLRTDPARNLYFIGTLHEKIGDQLSKAGTNHNRGLVIIGHWTFA